MEPLRASVTVQTPPERAFELFTEGMGTWWPKEFSWSQDKLEEIGIEPHEDGFAYERGPRGFTVHWGRVTAWDPPARMVLLWQIAGDRSPQPDPDRSSEVEIRFDEQDGATLVEVEHRAWERHATGRRSTATASSRRTPGPTRCSASPTPRRSDDVARGRRVSARGL